MELLNIANAMAWAERFGGSATLTNVLPGRGGAPGTMVALDLLVVAAGGSTPHITDPEEHIYFVISGVGEVSESSLDKSGGGEDGPAARVRPGSVIRLAPGEAHQIRALGVEELRLLVVTPLMVLSNRALGVKPQERHDEEEEARAPEPSLLIREPDPPKEVARSAQEPQPAPDISGLMRKASELAGQPRPERKRPAPEPAAAPESQPAPAEADEAEGDTDQALMELLVVFDGGSRGNPGQGYGSYLVQSPGRKPVIKRVEFGPNYTNNQAEYDSLLACLHYIIERLSATNRSPDGVALDIKTDSDLVTNQLMGTYKVKDAGLRPRHTEAMELLERFGAWQIEWQPREETVKLLGH